MGNFKDLGINKGLLMAVEEMGFTSPTAVQEQAIPYLPSLYTTSGSKNKACSNNNTLPYS
jgi:hypothetical protein